MLKLSAFDRFTMGIAPRWTVERLRARAVAQAFVRRNYEAASSGRRTTGWARNRGDANAVIAAAIPELRMHARDLVRNNGWAKKAQRVIANHTVGWGIVPKAVGGDAKAMELWDAWANSTECSADGRHTFAGIQSLAMRSIPVAGEVLIRRRQRKASDGLTIPLQLQVIEGDLLDLQRNAPSGFAGGPIIQGVEFDMLGRRAAYWLFDEHPGGSLSTGISRRINASEIAHVFYAERPAQARGVSWYGAAIVNLKDLDEYEDAELMKQKIAACFAAFVEDAEGAGLGIGETDEDDDSLESFEPGQIQYLPAGKKITMANPPGVTADTFANRNLRRIAAALGTTYEDLTGDYSQVNFSSGRMGRLAHWADIAEWQWNMMIPQLCNPVWKWAMEAAAVAGSVKAAPRAEWTTSPMPMLEPDKEALALQRRVRIGELTPSGMIREQGGDPEAHWKEYAEDMAKLDELKIKLDSDVRAVSQAGLTQVRAGAGGAGEESAPSESAKERAADAAETLALVERFTK